MSRKTFRMAYGRHYCKTCHQRCFPWDTLDARTEEPGGGILLRSLNAKLAREDSKTRVAWCWRCRSWTETYQETFAMLVLRYQRRKGVRMRQARVIALRKRSA